MRTPQIPTAWLVLALGLVALTALCGERTQPLWDGLARPVAGAAASSAPVGWSTYRNERYGYSFDYPSFCRFEPLPGACKAQPPEARGPECQCFLNGEDPDSVLLQAFVQEGEGLTLATWQVVHHETPAFNPPPNAELVVWLKEHFTWLQGLPTTPNVEIDGVPAVEVLTPRSPMAPSALELYYIKDGQLFRIQMLDVEGDGNAQLYEEMLRSFRVSSSS